MGWSCGFLFWSWGAWYWPCGAWCRSRVQRLGWRRGTTPGTGKRFAAPVVQTGLFINNAVWDSLTRFFDYRLPIRLLPLTLIYIIWFVNRILILKLGFNLFYLVVSHRTFNMERNKRQVFWILSLNMLVEKHRKLSTVQCIHVDLIQDLEKK